MWPHNYWVYSYLLNSIFWASPWRPADRPTLNVHCADERPHPTATPSDANALHWQQMAHRYRQIVDNLGEGMMVIRQGRIIFANPQSAAILGRPNDSLENQHALDAVHPDDRAHVAERLRARATWTHSSTCKQSSG